MFLDCDQRIARALLTRGCVRRYGQAHEHVDDPRIFVCRGVEEQPVLNKASGGGYCAALLGGCWANDGDSTEILVEKEGRLGHDQVGLELVGGAGGAIIRVDALVEI